MYVAKFLLVLLCIILFYLLVKTLNQHHVDYFCVLCFFLGSFSRPNSQLSTLHSSVSFFFCYSTPLQWSSLLVFNYPIRSHIKIADNEDSRSVLPPSSEASGKEISFQLPGLHLHKYKEVYARIDPVKILNFLLCVVRQKRFFELFESMQKQDNNYSPGKISRWSYLGCSYRRPCTWTQTAGLISAKKSTGCDLFCWLNPYWCACRRYHRGRE